MKQEVETVSAVAHGQPPPPATLSNKAGLSLRFWPFAKAKRDHRGRAQQQWIYLLIPGIFVAAIGLYPLAVLLRMSVSSVTGQNLTSRWPFTGLTNFSRVATSSAFHSSLWLSLEFTIALVLLDLTIGTFVAFWLSFGNRFAKAAESLMILGWALPPIVTGTAWRFLLQQGGFVSLLLEPLGLSSIGWLSQSNIAIWSMVLIVSWASIPFCATAIKAGIVGIPQEVVEAALIDGASTKRIATSIILPQLRNIIATLAILVIVYGFGSSFSYIYVVTGGGPGTATTTLPFLGYIEAFSDFNFGLAAAVAVISMIIVVGLALQYVKASFPQRKV